MSASCCGSARRTAALIVMAAALGVLVPAGIVLGMRAFREPPAVAVEVAVPVHVKPKVQLLFKTGYDIMSLPLAPGAEHPGVSPGSWIDVVAHFTRGDERGELTVLPDVVVLSADAVNPLWTGNDPNQKMISFQVDQRQAALVVLARRLNCELAVVPSRPDRPAWDYDATLARLKGLEKELRDAEVEVAPFPRAVP